VGKCLDDANVLKVTGGGDKNTELGERNAKRVRGKRVDWRKGVHLFGCQGEVGEFGGLLSQDFGNHAGFKRQWDSYEKTRVNKLFRNQKRRLEELGAQGQKG